MSGEAMLCARPGCDQAESRINGYCSVYCEDVDDLTAALKDAERVNADLRERIDTMARQELADIPEYVALERERERLAVRLGLALSMLTVEKALEFERRYEELRKANREALQEPAPQGAEAGE